MNGESVHVCSGGRAGRLKERRGGEREERRHGDGSDAYKYHATKKIELVPLRHLKVYP